jgi:hypothetical protein
MPARHRLSLLVFFSLGALPTLGAASYRVTVTAGETDRQHTIVTFALPAEARGLNSLIAADGRRTPLQVDAEGRGAFILERLDKGAIAAFELTKSIEKIAVASVTSQQAGDVLKFSFGSVPLAHYQMRPSDVPSPDVPEHYRHGAYLHPVFSPAGKLVTGDYPPDHRHQRGIWFSWTKTEFEGRHPDFWNMGKDKDGKFTGEIRFDRLVLNWNGPVHGGFESRHIWLDHTGGTGKPVLNESWRVTFYRPLGGRQPVHVIDFSSSQQCASKEALRLPKYHYGGLGMRGNAAWDPVDQVRMLTSNGDDRLKGDSTKARWVHLGGSVDGAPAGIAVLIHPANFRFPQPLRLNPKNPQLCVAPSQDGDWEIKPGDNYISQYRFIIADAEADEAGVERCWRDYANPPGVKLEPQ